MFICLCVLALVTWCEEFIVHIPLRITWLFNFCSGMETVMFMRNQIDNFFHNQKGKIWELLISSRYYDLSSFPGGGGSLDLKIMEKVPVSYLTFKSSHISGCWNLPFLWLKIEVQSLGLKFGIYWITYHLTRSLSIPTCWSITDSGKRWLPISGLS